MKKARPTPPRSPNWIDKHLAEQIRNRRHAIKMTLAGLGQKLGVSFQQVQKYEYGKNRFSVARLYEICEALDVPITSMFENLPRSEPTWKKKRPMAARSTKNPPG
jgi:transcriptional regulator with XRE-family HTH domain